MSRHLTFRQPRASRFLHPRSWPVSCSTLGPAHTTLPLFQRENCHCSALGSEIPRGHHSNLTFRQEEDKSRFPTTQVLGRTPALPTGDRQHHQLGDKRNFSTRRRLPMAHSSTKEVDPLPSQMEEPRGSLTQLPQDLAHLPQTGRHSLVLLVASRHLPTPQAPETALSLPTGELSVVQPGESRHSVTRRQRAVVYSKITEAQQVAHPEEARNLQAPPQPETAQLPPTEEQLLVPQAAQLNSPPVRVRGAAPS